MIVVCVPPGDVALPEVGVDHPMEVLLGNLTVDKDAAVDVAVSTSVLLDDDHVLPWLVLEDVAEDVIYPTPTLGPPALDDVPKVIRWTTPAAVGILR